MFPGQGAGEHTEEENIFESASQRVESEIVVFKKGYNCLTRIKKNNANWKAVKFAILKQTQHTRHPWETIGLNY